MKFFKCLLTLVLSTLYLVLSTGQAHAQDQFSVNASVTYNVQDSGQTHVVHDITLVNNYSTLYATTYSLSLQNIDVKNAGALNDKGQSLQTDVTKDGVNTNIKVTFPDAVVGKGSSRHFTISYDNGNFAVRTGEVWEVSIPKLADASSFNNYSTTLSIPSSFGLEAYISPQPQSSNESDKGKTYIFTKDQILVTGITAGFGQFQVFSFKLVYHLDSTQSVVGFPPDEIAIPPDTAYQKVYIQKIDPKPQNVTLDADGNWIAKFDLSHSPKLNVSVSGSVQIFASYRPFPKPTNQYLSDNLKETQYWQVNDSQIKQLAKELKTPEAIYNYVVKTLKYDFTRVQPNAQRLGALGALQNPTQAICMEYTDLFIAIARAAGIPAREINGYAYTENPQLQPLSLVADVLHAWPEYYDSSKGVWIPVDPTWGSTSGIDYFNKLDLRHFTFVIQGESDIKPPPPGAYKHEDPQKDVFVSFGTLPVVRNSIPYLSNSIIRNIPFFSFIYNIQIQNPGPAALYNIYPTVYFDGKVESRDFISVMPPYSSYNFQVSVPFSILGKDTPEEVKVEVGESNLTIGTNKTQVIVNSMLMLFIVFFVLVIGFLIKLKKITFKGISDRISKIYAKFNRKAGQNTN